MPGLWVDTHRPKQLDKFVVHRELGLHLQKLVESGDCPHFLFYGASGAGKSTLVMALLRELYGPGVEKVRVENKTWKIERPERKVEVELTTLSSAYHVEMSPSEAGNSDRYVVQEIIKDMAKVRPLDVASGQQHKAFKVLVLQEVDRLSKDAQHSLRRTMEKYSAGCRLVLVATNVSRVIEAVRSRCLAVRVPAATSTEVADMLQSVARAERVPLPPALGARLAMDADRNMRRAVLSLEAVVASAKPGTPLTDAMPLVPLDWEEFVDAIGGRMLADQTPNNLYAVRNMLYEVLGNCIAPETVLKRLVVYLLRKCDGEVKHEVLHWAAFYEHRLQEGQKPILHLEAFVARFMAVYKKFLVAAFS